MPRLECQIFGLNKPCVGPNHQYGGFWYRQDLEPLSWTNIVLLPWWTNFRSKNIWTRPWHLSLLLQYNAEVPFSSVQFSRSVVSDSLQPHGLQHTGLPCPSPTPGVYSNTCPLSRWCRPTISSSVIPFSSCPHSFPASGFFQMSQFFTSGGQSIGVSASASVLPMNTQDWSPLGWTGWIALQSKGLSRVFSSTTVQKTQFFSTQLSL